MMARLRGGFVGSAPDAVMAAELTVVAKAIRAGMEIATTGLKEDFRGQIASAGLGRKLGNAVGAKVYPLGREKTLHPVGEVRPRGKQAEDIFEAFNLGVTIRAKNGFWLAIPTKAARMGGRRITPAQFEQRTGIRLRLLAPRRSAKTRYQFLVGDATGRRPGRAVRPMTRAGVRQGRASNTTIFFILVPQVHLNKRLSFEAAALNWAGRVPEIIDSVLPQGLR